MLGISISCYIICRKPCYKHIDIGTAVVIRKPKGDTYTATYCGQKDGYCIVSAKDESFCIKSFTSTVKDFQDCGCKSFRFVKPEYIILTL